jgi:hypothetical protein
VTFAVAGCTGWRFVVEELQRAGITALLAEQAETADLRGPKRRAKTDKTDSRHLRTLLADGRLPLSWIPPERAAPWWCEPREGQGEPRLLRGAVLEDPHPARQAKDNVLRPVDCRRK